MFSVNIFLTFPGTCELAFNFYKSAFGGEFREFIRMGDDPTTRESTPEKDWGNIAYVELPLKNVLLYGDDTLENTGREVKPGTMTSISLQPDSKKEADGLINALSAGGNFIMKPVQQPWGYASMFTDKFGIKWSIWYVTPPPPKK
jgi:PhnB protein